MPHSFILIPATVKKIYIVENKKIDPNKSYNVTMNRGFT